MMRTAIVPGSFDPMTLGHLDVIKRAAKLFDSVIVAIMINPDKEGCFTFAQRKRIAELTTEGIDGVKVITAGGYLADLAAAFGAVAIVKGVRNREDFVYEQGMAVFNHERNPIAETIYLPAYGEYVDVSSTAVREMISTGKDTSSVLAEAAAEYIRGLGE
ncbi:MAG: pantetheine-phosphate adenylyltransferase [Clostridia bacterium]|nr:pantetheine-phosphate adenylyltransferase [Clostridia bacterium]